MRIQLFVSHETVVIKEVRIGEDSGLYQIIFESEFGTRTIWLGNIYLNRGSKTQIQTLFRAVEKVVPPEYLKNTFLVSDYNIDVERNSQENQLLVELAKSLGLRVNYPSCGTRKEAKLDFLVSSKMYKNICKVYHMDSSDHAAVVWQLDGIMAIDRKRITIVNKKLSDEVSMAALATSSSSKEFLLCVSQAYDTHRDRIYVQLNSRKIERNLFKLLVNSDGELTNSLTLRYWKQTLEDNERMRFSQMSKGAFQFLEKVYKYGQYEKREGSIVNKIQEEDKIISDVDLVNKALIGHLKTVQFSLGQKQYTDDNMAPFSFLNPPSNQEMHDILDAISIHKALAGDLVSDIVLEREYKEKACSVFKDIWSGIQIEGFHFKGRLIALNKKHPEIPRRDQFRPIVISGLIVKILEGRLVKPLRNYMSKRLHVSQTGFVPGSSVFVNIDRLFEYVKWRRSSGIRTYLLFLDFSSAYNTVLHGELFRILRERKVLDDLEIQLLQAIYSRNTIELGNESFRPNIGVAQGSIISPYLFNIYSEELLIRLEELGWGIRDLYGFADDHLVLNGSVIQLRRAIGIIKDWSVQYNISLNPAKSGILEVPPKYGNTALEVGSSLDGIPVVNSYKYLGVWIDQKLSPKRHLDFLFGAKKTRSSDGEAKKGKVNYLVNSLGPCFKDISFSYRTNLWITFIRPLFLPLATFGSIITESERESICTKLKVSLKKFLKLPRNFRDDILMQAVQIDFGKWIEIEHRNNMKRWTSRQWRLTCEKESLEKYEMSARRWLPLEFGNLLNRFTAFCWKCRRPFYPEHLEEHGVYGVRLEDIFTRLGRIEVELEETNNIGGRGERKKTKLKRGDVMGAFAQYLNYLIGQVDEVLNEFAIKF